MTTTPATDADVDTSDLDMLDDPHSHARCVICNGAGRVEFGTWYIAICGKRVMARGTQPLRVPPANACPDCLTSVCSGCGGKR